MVVEQNASTSNVAGRRILVGVGGGIAAYKVCEVVSTLAKAGALVRVILTNAAQQFVTPLTFAALSRHMVYTDAEFWSAQQSRPLHIELGEWADLFLIAPLTAHTLAQLVHGLADNLLMNTVLASTCPLLLAPAMNTDMWQQQTVRRNWQSAQALQRCHAVGPESGRLACDRHGDGRLAEPNQIIAHLYSLLYTQGVCDLAGKQILISAGGTREHLDPVRFIGNPSTGKMGVALALAAHHRGAAVVLVHAPMDPVYLANLHGLTPVTLQPVSTAAEMHQAMVNAFPSADWTLMAAAVADVKPQQYHPTKLPKSALPQQLVLAPVSDIIADLSQRKRADQRLVGFAAQTGDIITPAQDKLQRKQLDAIAANPIDQSHSGFGSDQNQGIFLDWQGRQQVVSSCSKLELSHQLLDFIDAIALRPPPPNTKSD